MAQKNIAELFGVKIPIISKHLGNIHAEGELDEKATVSKMETVQNEGGKTLEGKGDRNKKQADQKARDEFRKFNETQESDFDRFVKQVQNKANTEHK